MAPRRTGSWTYGYDDFNRLGGAGGREGGMKKTFPDEQNRLVWGTPFFAWAARRYKFVGHGSDGRIDGLLLQD